MEMEYREITSIEDPLFKKMHVLMQDVFPAEEILAFELWREPLEDPGIYVYVALQEEEVVGATEYRYYKDFNVAMTDFTIIGKDGLGVGPFLARKRLEHLHELAKKAGNELAGMFAEIYNPYLVEEVRFGGIKSMDPYVRREVLSHLGYRKVDVYYVHPSWKDDGEAVTGLDLCYMPIGEKVDDISADLVVQFLKRYYSVLPNKPRSWEEMVKDLGAKERVALSVI